MAIPARDRGFHLIRCKKENRFVTRYPETGSFFSKTVTLRFAGRETGCHDDVEKNWESLISSHDEKKNDRFV